MFSFLRKMKLLRRKLKNDMTVICEKRELPVVALSISNRFGAGSEDAKIKGIAHLIEHMVFTGTKTRTHEDISREIEKKGGMINAFTAQESTSFWFKLPSEHVFAGLEILYDILSNPVFPAEKFEKEKKVILEEIKMYHDDPQRGVYDILIENLYEKPFGMSIAGNEKTVSALKRDFVFDYFSENYSPEKYIVTIVGDVDFEAICSWLEKRFIAGKKKEKRIRIMKKQKESIEEREGIEQAHFLFGVHAPMMHEKDYSVLEVLDAWLASGMSSYLFLTIREQKGLAYIVQSSLNSEKSHSFYAIYTGTRKEAIGEVKKLILEGFAKASHMTEEDLSEAKERLIGLHQISREESSRVMMELLFYEMAIKAEEYYSREEKIRSVTLVEVKNLAKKLVKEYSTAAIVPHN